MIFEICWHESSSVVGWPRRDVCTRRTVDGGPATSRWWRGRMMNACRAQKHTSMLRTRSASIWREMLQPAKKAKKKQKERKKICKNRNEDEEKECEKKGENISGNSIFSSNCAANQTRTEESMTRHRRVRQYEIRILSECRRYGYMRSVDKINASVLHIKPKRCIASIANNEMKEILLKGFRWKFPVHI